jgi:hypothetical protein
MNVPLIKINIGKRTSISANLQKRSQFLGRGMHLIKVTLNVLNVLYVLIFIVQNRSIEFEHYAMNTYGGVEV